MEQLQPLSEEDTQAVCSQWLSRTAAGAQGAILHLLQACRDASEMAAAEAKLRAAIQDWKHTPQAGSLQAPGAQPDTTLLWEAPSLASVKLAFQALQSARLHGAWRSCRVWRWKWPACPEAGLAFSAIVCLHMPGRSDRRCTKPRVHVQTSCRPKQRQHTARAALLVPARLRRLLRCLTLRLLCPRPGRACASGSWEAGLLYGMRCLRRLSFRYLQAQAKV